MDASCIGEGYETILKQIHYNLYKLQQNSFGPFGNTATYVQFLMVRLFANYSYNFKYLKQPTFWVQGGIQGDKRQEEGFKGEIEVNRKWTYLLYNLTLLDTKQSAKAVNP